jgi:hypothetical protein
VTNGLVTNGITQNGLVTNGVKINGTQPADLANGGARIDGIILRSAR